jgi:dihydrofolate reductase
MSRGVSAGLSCMAHVTAHFSMSLDGFMAGPDQTRQDPLGAGGEELHRWMFAETMHPADQAAADRILAARGAYVMGRHMFGPVRGAWEDAGELADWRGWWGDEPPYRAPVFVLTHHPRASVEMAGGTTFHFVTGFEEALARATEAADGETVTIAGGASAVRQGLEAGVVDEVTVSHVPVVLGDGEAPVGGLTRFGAEVAEVTTSPSATHVRYVVRKR